MMLQQDAQHAVHRSGCASAKFRPASASSLSAVRNARTAAVTAVTKPAYLVLIPSESAANAVRISIAVSVRLATSRLSTTSAVGNAVKTPCAKSQRLESSSS